MDQPVTTNPFIIMLINMTVVFFVLIALSGLIHLIHMIDPTKEPEVESDEATEAAESAAIIAKLKENSSPAPAASPEEPQVEEGISPEVVAAISAAIVACGFSGQVRAVRIAHRNDSGWRRNAIDNGLTQI